MSGTHKQVRLAKTVSAKKSYTVDCRWQVSIRYMGRMRRIPPTPGGHRRPAQ